MATFDFRRFRWALTAIPVTSFRHNAQHCSAWSILLSHGCHGASRTARVHLRERLFPPPPDLPGSPARFADRGDLCRQDRPRSRRGTILTWSRELSFGYFLEAADDRLGDPGGQRGLRRRRGLHRGIFARTLHARLVDDLLVGPRAVRYARGFLVGHRLRDSPGRLVFLAPDHHRRPA